MYMDMNIDKKLLFKIGGVVVACLVIAAVVFQILKISGKRIGFSQQFPFISLQSATRVSVNDFHNGLSATLFNVEKFERMTERFPALFDGNNVEQTIITFIDTPTTTQNTDWIEDTVHGYSTALTDKTLSITIYVNIPLIKKSGWNTNSLSRELEYIIIDALYHAQRDLRGELRTSTLQQEQKLLPQRQQEIKNIYETEKHGLNLFAVEYE